MPSRTNFSTTARLLWASLAIGIGVLATIQVPEAFSHEGHDHPPRKVADEEAYRPRAIPDRIILSFTGDPAHTQAVTWRTSSEVTKGIAQIAVAGPNKDFAQSAKEVFAKTELLKSDLSEANYHTVEFTELKPATKYAYRVGDGVNWSEWFHLKTASDKAEPFSFIYFGDAQNDVREHWSRVIREAYSDAPKASFLLHAGDLINIANRDVEWGEWHGAGSFLNAMIPNVPTPGNHEYQNGKLSGHWRPQFALPLNGPEGLEETVYSFDYQSARIISLNSNTSPESQVPWLEEQLKVNPNRWTIVTFHHPVYSTARNRDNPRIRKAWKPIFDKYKVDLVLQGHDHTYGRTGTGVIPGTDVGTNVPAGTNARDEFAGTVYVVSVSGPKMYEINKLPVFNRIAENTQLYQIISIEGETLSYVARTATGDAYDGFTLKKRDGQVNELIEQIPETPERAGN